MFWATIILVAIGLATICALALASANGDTDFVVMQQDLDETQPLKPVITPIETVYWSPVVNQDEW